MNITIINQFYPPDASPTARLAKSLAEHRAAQGDQVTIIAGLGYLPESQTQPKLRIFRPAESGDTPGGQPVRVLRVATPNLGKRSLWRRCLSSLLFFLSAAWKVVWTPRQDVIICLTSPPFVVAIGFLKKLLNPHAQLILWNMDCYPEVAERSGYLRPGGALSRVLHGANALFARSIDQVVCLGSAMEALMQDRSGRDSPTVIIPTWQPLDRYPRVDRRSSNSTELTVLYAGNMGVGHEFDTILQAIKDLQQDPIRFIFNGQGAGRADVEAFVEEHDLTNVHVQDYVPLADLQGLMASADCALITLKENMLGVMSPSKLQTSLAMSLPILYIGPATSNVDDALQTYDCGASIRNGDTDGAIQFLRSLINDHHQQQTMQRRARTAFEEAYSDKAALPKFDQLLDDCRQAASRAA